MGPIRFWGLIVLCLIRSCMGSVKGGISSVNLVPLQTPKTKPTGSSSFFACTVGRATT